MMALVVRQPHASMIASGVKSIEYRGFAIRYRGPLLIVASKTKPIAAHRHLPRGVTVAVVEVTGCIQVEKNLWAWLLAEPKRVPPVAIPTHQRLWRVVDPLFPFAA
jgi:hypothetical protein